MQVEPSTQPTHSATHSCPLQSRSPVQLPHVTCLPQPSSTVPHSKAGTHLAELGTQPSPCPASPASPAAPEPACPPPAFGSVVALEHACEPTTKTSVPTHRLQPDTLVPIARSG